jgi:uncharacterized protein (TIGR03437 family)
MLLGQLEAQGLLRLPAKQQTRPVGSVTSIPHTEAGEQTVVVYAWGLGPTLPGATTGDRTPSAAPVVTLPSLQGGLPIQFTFGPNAPPALRLGGPPDLYLPAFLTPGQVGLYQINVPLPSVFPPVAPCGQGITSNLTITFGGDVSFDGAKICVTPPEQTKRAQATGPVNSRKGRSVEPARADQCLDRYFRPATFC